jgi:hypothetical protein
MCPGVTDEESIKAIFLEQYLNETFPSVIVEDANDLVEK